MDIRHEMEAEFEAQQALGRRLLGWIMTKEKLAELADALGYEDDELPSEALGLEIMAASYAGHARGWMLRAAEAARSSDNKRQDEAAPMPLDVDDEGKNDDRAEWALQALEAFQEATGADDCDAIGDLIADLAHLCDREGERFGWSVRDQIERGLRAYEQEITDEEPEEIDAAEVVGAV
jgi:hypothetical protein